VTQQGIIDAIMSGVGGGGRSTDSSTIWSFERK
jgi:hypothetical protein